ncbi:MAG TPA: Holliday junction resolvase RuvX [Gammaproteobacteria bacterium]|jgi:putative Holliday junction resolvase|nr:Holliday junction resolvase RuvX [Gammaproteobacteria bacterium]
MPATPDAALAALATRAASAPLTALGFDFGLKRIGVAVGQTVTGSAADAGAIDARDGEPEWRAIERLAAEWRPQAIAVGIPYNADGSAQPLTARAENFARELESRLNVPVFRIDERLSSHAAEAELKAERQAGRRRLRKTDIDSRAARLILESWLGDLAKARNA